MKKILVIFLFISSTISCNHSDEQIPYKKVYDFPIYGDLYSIDDFVKIELPKKIFYGWHKDNRIVPQRIAVTFYKERLFFSEFASNINYKIEFEDGFLKAEDNGEFGGGLYFVPFKEDREIEEIYSGNIRFVFEFQGELFAIAGGGHIVNDAKSLLLKIEKNDSEFSVFEKLEISSRAMSILVEGNRILVAGLNKFIIIEDFKEEILISEAFWYDLGPLTSLTIDDKENVYIGMFGGYAKLNLETKELEFFKLKDGGPSL